MDRSTIKSKFTTGSRPTQADFEDLINNAALTPSSDVTTIVDLLAIDISSTEISSIINVSGYYAANDGGGGLFRWVPNSAASSDGWKVFVPDSLRSSVQTFTQAATWLRSDRSETNRTLPHQKVLFGSCEFVYSDGAGSAASGSFITDIEMHGSGLDYLVYDVTGIPIPHQPFFDHSLGKFVADGVTGVIGVVGQQRLMYLCSDHLALGEDGNFVLRYRYATGNGRWVRVLSEQERVTPAMIGCKRNDATFNSYHRLAWLLRMATLEKRAIHLDGWYYYKGTFEIPEGCVISQSLPHTDAGLKVCPWTTIEVIDNLADNYDDSLPPGRLDYDVCSILPVSGIQKFTLQGVKLHGNLAGNAQFLEDPDYDTDNLSETGAVSQSLRESPVWSGLAMTTHGNRVISPTLVAHLNDVDIGDYGGSCLQHAIHVKNIQSDNLRLGNSESGRVKYGGSGIFHNLWLYGYSRTAIERGYSHVTHGHKYTWKRPDGTTPVRLWPENAVPANITATLGNSTVTGIDHDLTGSDYGTSINLRGESMHFDGRIVMPTGDTTCAVFSITSAAPEVICCACDLDITNQSTRGTGFASVASVGIYHAGSVIRIRLHETYDSGVKRQAPYTLPALPNITGFTVMVLKSSPAPNLEQQDLTLHLFSELQHSNLIVLSGLAGNTQTVTPSDYMPTTVRLSGQILNQSNKLIGGTVNGQAPASGITAAPVRVYCDGLTFRVFDPTILYRGDALELDRAFFGFETKQLQHSRRLDQRGQRKRSNTWFCLNIESLRCDD